MLNKKEAACCCAILRRIVYHDGSVVPTMDRKRMRAILDAQGISGMMDCANEPALLPFQNKQNAVVYASYQYALRETVCLLFREMDKRGLVCALLKGEALSACYPADVIRASGDIDLYLPGKQREAFRQMMDDLSFTLQDDIISGQEGVDDYVSESGIHLEVHCTYFQRLSARQRKLLKEHGFFSSKLFERGGGYWTLKPEAHLVYLVYHADKHLVNHGLTLRMMMDLTQFVNRYADEIDQNAFRALISDLGLTRLTNAIFCWCEKYMGMRRDFWRKTGTGREFFVRLMLRSTADEVNLRNWERFFKRAYPYFYSEFCEESEAGYTTRHYYHPHGIFKKKANFITFVFWWLIRLFWGFEVDFSNEAV